MPVGSSFTRCTECRSRLCPALLHPDAGLMWPLMLACCVSLLPVCSRCFVLVHLWMPTSFFMFVKLWAVAQVKAAVGCALSVNSPWHNVYGATGARAVGAPGTFCMFDKPKRVNECRPPCETQFGSRLLHQCVFFWRRLLAAHSTESTVQEGIRTSSCTISAPAAHGDHFNSKGGLCLVRTRFASPLPPARRDPGFDLYCQSSALFASQVPGRRAPRSCSRRHSRLRPPQGRAACLRRSGG